MICLIKKKKTDCGRSLAFAGYGFLTGCIFLLGLLCLILPVAAETYTTVPVASFTASPASGTAPLTVTFTDVSANATSWSWSFGDGNTSTTENPSWTYTSVGTYTATLTSTNSFGSNSTTKTITVKSAVTTPVSSFSASATSGTAPLTVTFTDTSTNSPTSWSWIFGDGNTSTSESPSWTYTSAGTYTVYLTAGNSAGQSTSYKVITVSSATTTPVSSFTSNATSGVLPFAVQFNDTSTNTPTSWSWVFGDGYTSTTENPVHTYTSAGTYTVYLTAANSAGSSVTYVSDYITVTANATPVASFSSNVSSGTVPFAVQFNDTSTNTPTSWYWEFGDGYVSSVENPVHTYSVSGVYTVTFTATNGEGSNVTTEEDYITASSAAISSTYVATPLPTSAVTPLFTAAPTYAITTSATTTSSVDDWLAKQNAIITTATTKKAPGYDFPVALAGFAVVAGIVVFRRQ